MFDFIKSRFVVAETDGIRFYTTKALLDYTEEKEKRERLKEQRKGKNLYTFDMVHGLWEIAELSRVKNILEANGCFDYEVVEGDKLMQYSVKYWAHRALVGWNDIGL